MIMQIICAFFGTLAFALIFGIPRKHFISCGLIGGVAWAVYLLLLKYAAMSQAFATFFATICVMLLSRFAAVHSQCPATVFIISGIIPLAPGTSLYWTVYYLVTDQLENALNSGIGALKLVVAIVLGIALIFELPSKLFAIGKKKDYK